MTNTPKPILKKIQEAKDKQLKELSLRESKLTEIPSEVFELEHLEELDVTNNKIRIIPEEIRNLKNLKRVDVDGNPLEKMQDIPGLVIDYKQYKKFRPVLTKENIFGLVIESQKTFPEEVIELENLSLLEIVKMDCFSESILMFKNLKKLTLTECQLTVIPEYISKLQNLTSLNLRSNQLTEIPEHISKLQNLTDLYLRSNQLTEIQEHVSKLQNLTSLDLSSNQVKEIPEHISKLQNLTSLDLSSNQIKEIPEHISKLQNLTILSLSSNQIKEIPEQISKLQNLTSLNLSFNQLTEIPEHISKLQKLTELYLIRNQLKEIPEHISKLQNLTSLYLSSNQIKEIPEHISKLQNLTELSLWENQLTETPEHISKLQNLTSLSLWKNQLTEIPEHISKLQNLTTLYLSGNQIKEIPEHISKLQNLTTLYLSGNQIKEIPEHISKLQNLTSLSLWKNQLTEIPEHISKLQNLTELNLSSNQLTEIPEHISKLQNLTSLDLSSNQLTEIPEHITKLQNLTSLYLGGNQIKEIPEHISKLQNLTSLSLFFNQIKEIPEHILQLKHLKTISVSNNAIKHLPRFLLNFEIEIIWKEYWFKDGINFYGNPLVDPMPEIVARGRTAIVNYFEAFDRGDVLPLNETKLIILGDGEAGKTSLLKRILGEGFNQQESQTQGINIKDWNIKTEDKNIRVHIWDFGGQEIMHATHQFFLTERCIYLIVLDSRKDEKPEYWLKHIETYGGNSPVFIVMNKIDENPGFEVDRKFLLDKYKGIKDFFKVSCKENSGIPALVDSLKKELGQINILQMFWPLSWFNVKKELETSTKDYVSHDSYTELCQKEGIEQESEQTTLITFLHDLGVFLHFDSLSLSDIHVINPHWITNAVYSIITSKLANEYKGKLHNKDISNILDSKKYPTHRQNYIIEIMKKFELCYSLDEERILIPGLLSETEPDFIFEKEKSLQFVIDYNEFMPSLIVPRFMVKVHFDISISWRNGALLKNDSFNSTALVRFDRFDKKAFIYVNGERKIDFFSIIWNKFTEIHKSFGKLDFKELIPLPGFPNSYVEYKDLIDLEIASEAYYNKHRTKFLVSELLDGIQDKAERIDKNPELKEKMKKSDMGIFSGEEMEREYIPNPVIPEKESPKRKILFLSANPTGKNPLNPAEEVNAMEALLKLGDNKKNFIMVDKCLKVIGENIYDILEKHKPNLIHISAHGTKDGILFENRNENAEPVDADYFCGALEEIKGVEIILFSSCNSESIAKAVSKQAKYCIGYSKPIPDIAATYFTQKFYEYYFETQSTEDAFTKAKRQLKLNKNKYGDKDTCPSPHEIVKLFKNGEEVQS